MKPPLLVLVFLSLAAAAGAADAPPAKKKSWAKPSGSSPSAQPGARVERKKPGFAPGGEGLTQTGGGAISSGGEAVAGAGISKGAADKRAKANPGAGSSSGGGGAAGGAPAKDSAPTTKSFENAKVYVTDSWPTGLFVRNGTVCRTGQVYTRTTGLHRSKPPMGCASPFDNNDCMDVKNHRKFEANEWWDPFTIQTIVNGADYPPGKYGIYLSYSKTDVKRVGFVTLKTCAAPAPKCGWTSPDAVIGPCNGPGCSSPPCSTANQGAQGMGGGGMWTCTCN